MAQNKKNIIGIDYDHMLITALRMMEEYPITPAEDLQPLRDGIAENLELLASGIRNSGNMPEVTSDREEFSENGYAFHIGCID